MCDVNYSIYLLYVKRFAFFSLPGLIASIVYQKIEISDRINKNKDI